MVSSVESLTNVTEVIKNATELAVNACAKGLPQSSSNCVSICLNEIPKNNTYSQKSTCRDGIRKNQVVEVDYNDTFYVNTKWFAFSIGVLNVIVVLLFIYYDIFASNSIYRTDDNNDSTYTLIVNHQANTSEPFKKIWE